MALTVRAKMRPPCHIPAGHFEYLNRTNFKHSLTRLCQTDRDHDHARHLQTR
jgi:hypothetical protein